MAQTVYDMQYDQDSDTWISRVTRPLDFNLQYDPAKHYQRVLFRDGYTLQGQELNEIQEIVARHVRGIGNAMLSDGDIIKDAQVVVNIDTGEVQAQAGKVYLKGMVRDVAAGTFFIPVTGVVTVGLYLSYAVVSELEDPALRNPANAIGADEPGAWRLQERTYWGYAGDGNSDDFYPVHTVEDGAVRAKEPPPSLEAWNQSIARYDRDSTNGGNYIAEGLVVRSAGITDTGEQMYSISEGRARVNGWGVEFPTSKRVRYAAAPDLRAIPMEMFTVLGSGDQRIDVAHPPISRILSLSVPREKTVTVVHGAYSGCSDALPDTGIMEIVRCRQGDTVYEPATDYKKNGDMADWSPLGNEPQTGSTYECTYRYIDQSEPENPDFDGFSVSGAIQGSSVVIIYEQAVPRKDRLCLTQDGGHKWIKGVPAEYNPRQPDIPAGMLPLATVTQTWRDAPQVANDAPRSMSFDELAALHERMDSVMGEVVRTRLESDISTREAGARAGIFVDPLTDDNNRDQGIAQSAAVFGGQMTLSISASVHSLNSVTGPVVPAWTPEIVLEQPLRTGDMKINQYMNFDPMPAKLTLDPAIDMWTETRTTWESEVTRTLTGGIWSLQNTVTETLASSTTKITHLRQIPVSFSAEGFGPGEIVSRVLFDGIEVITTPASIVAGPDGALSGRFVIPANVHAGAKTVEIHGRGGSFGSAVFVGEGTLTSQTLRNVTTITRMSEERMAEAIAAQPKVDPLCQTTTPAVTRMYCGVDLWFTAKDTEVRVQARDVSNGQPTSLILAEGRLKPQSIVITGNGHTRALWDMPMYRQAGREFGIVALCNDATASLALAEGGKFDAYSQKWVSGQAYTVGVLLSSSNASTWTAHQNMDLTFRLLACKFLAGPHEVTLGTAAVTDATDLVLFAVDETPTADTRVEYELTLPDGSLMTVAAGQPVRLTAPITGTVTVKARLYGTEQFMPILWPGAQLVAGTVSESGDYYSRSITAVSANRVLLIYDAVIPSGAMVTPELQIDGGAWESLGTPDTVQQGDGVVEYTLRRDLSNATLVKARFTLTGNAAARPSVRNIRLMAVK